eukprot:SAG31_NODE_4163_length_3520_cov_3.090032_4_plen_124_part_00
MVTNAADNVLRLPEQVLAEVDQWEFSLIAVVTLITFVGRGLTVLVLTAGYNCAAPVHKKTSLRSQAVMTAAGLRGGTAYALAMKWDGNAGRIGPVETLTMGIIIVCIHIQRQLVRRFNCAHFY